MHGDLFCSQLFQILMNAAVVCLFDHVFSGTFELVHFTVAAGAAYTAAVASHALDKVAGESAAAYAAQ